MDVAARVRRGRFKRIRVICLGFLLGSGVALSSEAATRSLPFRGEIQWSNDRLHLSAETLYDSSFTLTFFSPERDRFRARLDLQNVRLVSSRLSSQIEFLGRKTSRGLRSRIISRYTFWNDRPVDDFSGDFFWRDRRLLIEQLSLGRLSVRGELNMSAPYALDLQARTLYLPLIDFLNFFAGEVSFPVHGDVIGRVHLSGNLRDIQLAGDLKSFDGAVKELSFRQFHLVFRGVYPWIDIDGTRVVRDDGFVFTAFGSVNLSDKDRFEAQIQALVKKPLIHSQGEDWVWTFKRIEHGQDEGTTEFKYILPKDTENTAEREDGLLGVERRLTF